jgi:hypothetical protein
LGAIRPTRAQKMMLTGAPVLCIWGVILDLTWAQKKPYKMDKTMVRAQLGAILSNITKKH